MALAGKVAVVTGASSGIGACLATTLAKAGAKVVLAARREEKMALIVAEIKKDGGQAVAIKCDVGNREQVQNLVETTEVEFGSIDILINNAGIGVANMMKNLNYTDVDKMINVNIHGSVNCTAEVVNSMLKRKTGHIVFISSSVTKTNSAGCSIYIGCKCFMEGLALSLRKELAKEGIKVTVIQPGCVMTEASAISYDQEANEVLQSKFEFQQLLESSDVANAVLYAVSQAPHVAVNEILLTPSDDHL